MIPRYEKGIETPRRDRVQRARRASRRAGPPPDFGNVRSRLAVTLVPLLAAGALAAGCAATSAVDLYEERSLLGRSSEGRPIHGIVLGDGGDTVLLLGVIHGNEPAGAPLLERFTADLRRRPEALEKKRVVIVPIANPDGLARGVRGNARGVDLNRNFPAANWKHGARHGEHPASEAETRVMLKLLRQFQPSRILAVHSPLHCVNYDGPAEPLAMEMAEVSGYPLRASVGYPTPGSLGSYAGIDLGIPTITLELPKGALRNDDHEVLSAALETFVRRGSPAQGALSRRTPAP